MHMRRTKTMGSRLAWALLFCLPASCNTVDFYQKGSLQGPLMEIGGFAPRGKFRSKVHYSTEGSAGGLSTTAGGGCGCY